MNHSENRSDRWSAAFARWVLKWRWPILALTLIAVAAAATGARNLGFASDYRVFFSRSNPQLRAYEALQNIYTKNDNVLFVLEPKHGGAFDAASLDAVEALTTEAWKLPYAIRVDAVTNFQNTVADGDELIVGDLVRDPLARSAAERDQARRTALAEPALAGRLISPDARVTGVNVTLQLPERSPDEVTRVVAAARALSARIGAEHPDVRVRITGMAALNNAFVESSMQDMSTLMPLMFVAILIMTALMLRTVSGTLATMTIIAFSSLSALGIAGWLGMRLTPPSAVAPTLIMTLAVADSVHLLVTMLREMRRGLSKRDAIVESLRVNLGPVFLTSLTTAIGFLSMNSSDAPPFRDLGNITTIGVAVAFVLSVLFLPAVMAVLPVRVRVRTEQRRAFMERFGDFVVARRRLLLWGSSAVTLLLALLVPRNQLNDQFVRYFDPRVTFRSDTDFAVENLTGVYAVEHSLGADGSGGISDPAYLATLDRFADWYRSQPGVVHVSAFSDVMKRLNRSMHADDAASYRVPDDRELAAQYLLLYELSLPFGLDLNNQVNVDKSATRFTATLSDVSARDIRETARRAEDWLRANAPASMYAPGSGSSVMFAHISERNIKGMLGGTLLALVLISISLAAALRSVRFGLLSLLPNLVPVVMAFGVWGLVVGQINVGLSVVAGMTLGIVVDDTIHFLSKYLRARREKGLSPQDAVRSAFASVGTALVTTSVVLIAGFMILALSTFDLNGGMARLTAVTIAFALLADFLLLPPLLMALDNRGRRTVRALGTDTLSPAWAKEPA